MFVENLIEPSAAANELWQTGKNTPSVENNTVFATADSNKYVIKYINVPKY